MKTQIEIENELSNPTKGRKTNLSKNKPSKQTKDNTNEKVRKNFILTNQTADKISTLSNDLGDTTNSNVVTLAVTLLEMLVEAKNNGERIYFKDAKGKTREVTILI